MFTRKALGVLMIVIAGMLVLRAEPTRANLSTRLPSSTIETHTTAVTKLGAQESTVEVSPLSDPIGFNFVIRNETGLVEEHPVIAFSTQRQEYLVVWYNDRPGNDDIRGQRVSKNGTLVGGPFYISAGAGAERRYPAVAYNSKHDHYLIVWEHNDGLWDSIRARRVSGTGVVLDTSDIVITSGSNIITPAKPAVDYAYTPDKYLVVWQETFHPIPIQTDILGRVVTSSGAPDGSSFTISKDPGNYPRREPDLAYNRKRNEYLVVWQQYDNGANFNDIYGRRVTGGGVSLNPAGIVIEAVSVSSTNPSVAALPNATTEGQYLVVFELKYTPVDIHISSRFVDGGGVVGAGQYFAGSLEDETNPSVAGNESTNSYLVVWSRPTTPPFVYDYIEGRTISAAGQMGGNKYVGGFPLADHAVVASGSMGDFLVAFKDQQPPSVDSGIYGQLWGNRTYLPLTLRNH
jgi:hypothetical protein